ncbi:DUF6443 domain-containing protein [Flavobacterium sp. H122]|uniref:DUF6443 domain-containing protein n=1 Tax=Flavobacterium sp. H122 TaxID=2529860 RepID=UPI00145B127C|nr:DUF6443 domain-containing protein [Flavobacterium sp. H122]
MKKLIIALFFPALALAQSTDQNFVKTTTYKGPGATNPSAVVTYFDGLGRPIQKIDNAQSNTGKDIVTHIEYNAYGRQPKEFLPYVAATADMLIKTTASTEVLTFYNKPEYENTSNPYSEKLFEASPLNRVFEQAAPGNAWALSAPVKHTIRLDYQANSDSDAVKLFKVTTTWNGTNGVYDISINSTGNYPANELYKTITKDENWTSGNNNTTEEFKDKEGRVVLKRTYNNAVAHDTYYVYDNYGNLTYVIPPLANGAFDQQTLDGLCYQYKYDHRNRLAEKKLPGKQWEYIIYDKLDRVLATGPALSPFTDTAGANGWLITKYDAFNRPVLTAWYNLTVNATQRGVLQNSVNGKIIISETKSTTASTVNGVGFNYTTNAWPESGYHVLTVNYYDDYVFPHAETIPSTALGQIVYYNNTQKPKGLPTGSWVRVPETTSLYRAEKSITYYDYKARPIRTKTINHLGGYTQVDSQLDFIGKVLATETRHKRLSGDIELLTLEEFTYSAQDRLVTHTHQINGGAKQLLVKNTYDELGQLLGKNVGGTDVTGTSSLQKVDYKYNIRGWLKEINDVNNLTIGTNPQDLFAFKINYNDNVTTGLPANQTAVTQLFNGNISETFWRTAADNKTRKYGYQYDNLNRLTNAIFQDPNNTVVTNSYNETLTYDKNGNILTLNRKNYISSSPFNTTIDNLTYTYGTTNKNELRKVGDSTGNTAGFKNGSNTDDDFAYDANGNMTLDKNKGITAISYNHLNLPVKIDFGTNKIEYLYNATGQKVQKKVTNNAVVTTSEYLGGYQYKANALEFFPQAEGHVKNTAGVYSYVFNYTDHLGNVRVSYSDTNKNGIVDKSNNEILEESNYYPFGLKHEGYNTNNYQANYKYKYNGKEFQDELGLNMYDFGMRNYEPAIGRWMNMDPKGELLEMSSPYMYALNCPLIYVDKDGELPILINGKTMSDSERADVSYWTQGIVNTIKNSGIANPGGELHYVDGNRGWNHYNGKSWASKENPSFPSDRAMGGRLAARGDWQTILSKLARDPKTGKIIEKIQIYTHSRGAAFGVGYTEELLKLIKENSSQFADADNVIDYVFNMAPHQSDFLTAPDGVDSYSMDHSRDKLSDNDMGGLEGAFTSGEKSSGAFGAHSITSFGKDLKAFTSAFLKGGTSKDVTNNFIKMMKEKYGVTVTVKE